VSKFRLIPHPDFPASDIERVDVIASRQTKNRIGFRFIVTGSVRELDIPTAEHPSDRFRRDELWRSTCFEAFVRPFGRPGYFETNLSPAGHWAVYAFESYRNGMWEADASASRFRSDDRRMDLYDISGAFLFEDLRDDDGRWHVNLSAVIAGVDGSKSYWALAHAPGPPDFHNPDCFIATLPAPDAS
jgi:hypothetical protein